jgi:hypothetical protein
MRTPSLFFALMAGYLSTEHLGKFPSTPRCPSRSLIKSTTLCQLKRDPHMVLIYSQGLRRILIVDSSLMAPGLREPTSWMWRRLSELTRSRTSVLWDMVSGQSCREVCKIMPSDIYCSIPCSSPLRWVSDRADPIAKAGV